MGSIPLINLKKLANRNNTVKFIVKNEKTEKAYTSYFWNIKLKMLSVHSYIRSI